MSRVGSNRVGNCSKCHGSGRVGSGRVKSFSNLTSRVGSGREFFISHGSGQVMTREKRVTGGSGQHDPRVDICPPAGRARIPSSRIRRLNTSRYCTQRIISYQYSKILLWYHIRLLKHRQMHVRRPTSIHTNYSQATYRSGAQK